MIATQFSETKKRETERMMQERKRYNSSSTLASNSEPGGCYDEIIKYIAHVFRKAKRRFNRKFRNAQGRRQHRDAPEKAISLRRKRRKKLHTVHLHHHHHHHHHHYHISSVNPTDEQTIQAPRASPEFSDIDPLASPRRPTYLTVPSTESLHNNSDGVYPSTSGHSVSDQELSPYHHHPHRQPRNSLGGAAGDVLIKGGSNSQPTVPSSTNYLGVSNPNSRPLSRTTSLHNQRTTKGAQSAQGSSNAGIPEILAFQGAKTPMALATPNQSLLTTDVMDRNRLQQPVDSKGMYVSL